MSNVTTLRTRKPTGRPSWPLILLAGEAKTGKSWSAAEFTGDPRVGRSFVLDLGEGSADEYIVVPGADYEIIDHNGQWIDIIAQVEAVRDFARAELAAGHKPVCLIVDSMTAEWGMLSAWTDTRARRSNYNRKALAADPDAEIDISSNYWNDANSRHNRLMNILKTFPGVVIMTALETEKTQFGPDGKPVKNAPKVARPDAQKRVTADATVWVRLSHDVPPTIVGIRSPQPNVHNIKPGQDRPKPWPGFTLAKLVFEHLGMSTETTQVRAAPVLDADQVAPGEEPEPPSEERPASPQRGPQRTAEQNADYAKAGTEKLLTVSNVAEAKASRAKIKADPIADVDVWAVVGEDRRAVLGIDPERGSLNLADLADLVVGYIERRNLSVNDALGGAPAVAS